MLLVSRMHVQQARGMHVQQARAGTFLRTAACLQLASLLQAATHIVPSTNTCNRHMQPFRSCNHKSPPVNVCRAWPQPHTSLTHLGPPACMSTGSSLSKHPVLVLGVGHSTNGSPALEIDQPLLTCRRMVSTRQSCHVSWMMMSCLFAQRYVCLTNNSSVCAAVSPPAVFPVQQAVCRVTV